jgi:hypothetical protein
MYLQKTDQAIRELAQRSRQLVLKARALLLLADGQKSDIELLTMVQADAALLESLIAQGYLVRRNPLATASAPVPRVTPPAADTFDGRRSLATARMFLFDLSERLFARRDPALAQGLRERFRQARDRTSMMEVARDLLRHIEEQAGASRADEVSARLSMLLPDEIHA